MAETKTISTGDGPLYFLVLVVIMVIVSGGQLFFLAGRDSFILGLPVWVWTQLVLLCLLLGLAWLATDIVTDYGGR